VKIRLEKEDSLKAVLRTGVRRTGAVRTGGLRTRRGFSLVEILIVVVILGILAAIAVPKFSNAATVSRENTLKENLRLLRTQIGVYYTQHTDCYPGYPGGDITATPAGDVFVNQMTQCTDTVGHYSANPSVVYKFGPYIQQMPGNPVNGLITMKIIAAAATMTADGSTGWLYQPSTGAILPNQAGNDSEGKHFSDY
jgi:prepilin-type N-terminal cleavage/methylation domain-containing protein